MQGITGTTFTEYSQPKTIDNQTAANRTGEKQIGAASIPTQSESADLMLRVGPAYKLDGSLDAKTSSSPESGASKAEIKELKRTGEIDCETCKNRTYQDGSDDPGVSFKSPANISPEASVAAVKSHENEHVVNEQANARKDNRKVISQNVQIFMDVCPECGKAYASGGVTKTTTAADNAKNKDAAGDTANTVKNK